MIRKDSKILSSINKSTVDNKYNPNRHKNTLRPTIISSGKLIIIPWSESGYQRGKIKTEINISAGNARFLNNTAIYYTSNQISYNFTCRGQSSLILDIFYLVTSRLIYSTFKR